MMKQHFPYIVIIASILLDDRVFAYPSPALYQRFEDGWMSCLHTNRQHESLRLGPLFAAGTKVYKTPAWCDTFCNTRLE